MSQPPMERDPFAPLDIDPFTNPPPADLPLLREDIAQARRCLTPEAVAYLTGLRERAQRNAVWRHGDDLAALAFRAGQLHTIEALIRAATLPAENSTA